MVEGLKLTIPGEELRALLEQRIQDHEQAADGWEAERARTPDQATDDKPLLPDHMCANEAERHLWRAEVLAFIRDHINAAEVYRLSEADVVFGELLPPKPDWVEQSEYEERTSVGFYLGRLAKSVGEALPHVWRPAFVDGACGGVGRTEERRTHGP